MAFIDFSLDSRIRKKYVPLVTQQRYLRHVKRISARNLILPQDTLNTLIATSPGADDVEKTILDYLKNDEKAKKNEDDFEYRQVVSPLLSKLNLYFFFTLHLPPRNDCDHCTHSSSLLCECARLVYISELARGTCPSWKSFEGSSLVSPSVSNFLVRIHYLQLADGIVQPQLQEPQTSDLKLLSHCVTFLVWDVSLSGLVYVGEEVPKDARLAANTIIIGCAEGFYTSLDCIASEELKNHIAPPTQSNALVDGEVLRDSYSHEKLTRIQMFQIIIRNTADGVNETSAKLETSLERDTAKKDLLFKLEKTQTLIDFLASVLKRKQAKLSQTKVKLVETENKMFERSSEMSQRMQILKEEIKVLLKFKSTALKEVRRKLEKTRFAISARRRIMAKEVFTHIYPIVPFPDFSGFTIRSVFLPDSRSTLIEKHDPKMISVALGYVTHLFVLSSSLLDVVCHHQLIPYGSQSMVVDLINNHLHESERVLPLYLGSGKSPIYFKYGLFLLNEMIVFNRRLLGKPSKSGSATLANLYSLFTECLLVDNYSSRVDNSLNQFDDYTPSLQISYREAKELDCDLAVPSSPRTLTSDEAELLNQSFLNDINFIKDNDVMNDHLWKEVERLTELVVSSTPRLTAKERGKDVPEVSEEERQRQQTAFLDEARRVILNQRKARRTASNRRLSQVTSSLTLSGSPTPSCPSSTPSWIAGGGTPAETRSRTESIAIPQRNVRQAAATASSIPNNVSALSASNHSHLLISTSPTQFDDPNSFRHFQSIRRSLQSSELSTSPSSSPPWRPEAAFPENDNSAQHSSSLVIRKISTASHPCSTSETIASRLGDQSHISTSLDRNLNEAMLTPTRQSIARRTRFSSQSSITNVEEQSTPSSFLNADMLNAKYDSDNSSIDAQLVFNVNDHQDRLSNHHNFRDLGRH